MKPANFSLGVHIGPSEICACIFVNRKGKSVGLFDIAVPVTNLNIWSEVYTLDNGQDIHLQFKKVDNESAVIASIFVDGLFHCAVVTEMAPDE